MRKLVCISLKDALKDMAVGETCIAPDGLSLKAIQMTINRLKEEGMLFQTSTRTGVITITKLQSSNE